ncbi:helicase C-terminal domain-containing protein [Alicyclobacillus herbarius]|uniref:helicase C-terminal domain-containing protein n=1 Tax=Alicyclobacillus herbarius TaxID=122960 RepID=UPI00041B3F4B|nr:helicase C-terminal domain-containing protein [Alicyclobacillus herbarius]
MKFVVLDLETTGLSPDRHEILEIGAVEWIDGQIGETFHSLIRPASKVDAAIFELTGLSPADLMHAPPMADVLPRLLSFLEGHVLAGHHIEFDLGFLHAACEAFGYVLPVSEDALDTLHLSRILCPQAREHRLIDLARRYNIPVRTPHRALADAEVTAHALTALATQAKRLPQVTLQTLVRLASLYSGVTGAWFAELVDQQQQESQGADVNGVEVVEDLVFRSPQPWLEDRPSSSDQTEDWKSESAQLLSSNSPLAEALPGFEVRPGQQKMVVEVAKSLAEDLHLIAEAGTGTGKSLAYLIPAALYARRHDTRVVISTHTIALQDQIAERDFPTLRKVIPEPLRLTVFKGRTHYLCMRKLRHEVAMLGWTNNPEEIRAYMRMLVWLTETESGSREELALSGSEQSVWPRVQSESETCINKRCPFFKPCYYFRARAKAYEADIVVTNHALVMTDLKADHRVLPPYEKLILDEAHHLEEEATRQLEDEVRSGHLHALLARLVRDRGRQGVLPELQIRLTERGHHALVEAVMELIDICAQMETQFEQVFAFLHQLLPAHTNEVRVSAEMRKQSAWTRYEQVVHQLTELWRRAEPKLTRLAEAAAVEDDETAARLLDAVGYFPVLGGAIDTLGNALEESSDWVTWIERSAETTGARTGWRGVNLHRTPLSIASILEERLFSKKSSVVLTSATLSVEGRFNYIKDRLGLKTFADAGKLSEVRVASPFRLREQVLLCVPNDVPELARLGPDEAARWLTPSLVRLAEMSRGKVLALFTSHQLLRAVAAKARAALAEVGCELFAQGLDGSRTQILEAYRTHDQGVLFGAQSFWEGIDLPGDQLRTLVIVRLPFAPPTHPVTEARHEQLERNGKSAFWQASLPEAVVRFRQGFGRLIRTTSDRGAVVVYDTRLVQSRYGRVFLRSLDGVRPVVGPEAEVLSKIGAFFQSENACQTSRVAD